MATREGNNRQLTGKKERERERETDRQTDRQTEREREKDREKVPSLLYNS